MSGITDVLHALIDVAAGRRNLSPADADQLHDFASEPEAPAEASPEPGPDAAADGA